MTKSKRTSRLVRIALFAVGWLFVAGLAALQLAPDVPRTLRGWMMFVVFAPPLYVVGEIAAEKYARGWGERNVLPKTLKAAALVVGVVILLIAFAILGA
jgi:hypothetical protein